MFLAQEVDQIVRSFGRIRGARGSARIDPGIVLLTGPYASRCGSLQIGSWCGVRYAGASIVWILGQGRVCVCRGGRGQIIGEDLRRRRTRTMATRRLRRAMPPEDREESNPGDEYVNPTKRRSRQGRFFCRRLCETSGNPLTTESAGSFSGFSMDTADPRH